MCGVELDALQLIEIGSGRHHELDRTVDVTSEQFVARVRGIARETLIPTVHLPEVGEPTLGERAHQIQRGCRGVVPLHQAARVGGSRFRGEVVAVDDIAPIRRKSHSAARLVVTRAGFRELPRHPPHLDDRSRSAVGQNNRHLQDGLDAVTDLFGCRSREGLGAITALKNEGVAGGGSRQSFSENVDLARENERGEASYLGGCGARRIRIRPHRLLFDRERSPMVETRDDLGVGRDDGVFGRIDHGNSFCVLNPAG